MKAQLPRLNWHDGYKIGHPEIDREHVDLFDSVNAFVEATLGGGRPARIDTLLDALGQYASTHFENEESLMRVVSYRKYREHKLRHSFFLETFRDYSNAYEEGVDITEELAHFVQSWLTVHVMETDMEFGRFIQATQVSAP